MKERGIIFRLIILHTHCIAWKRVFVTINSFRLFYDDTHKGNSIKQRIIKIASPKINPFNNTNSHVP